MLNFVVLRHRPDFCVLHARNSFDVNEREFRRFRYWTKRKYTHTKPSVRIHLEMNSEKRNFQN